VCRPGCHGAAVGRAHRVEPKLEVTVRFKRIEPARAHSAGWARRRAPIDRSGRLLVFASREEQLCDEAPVGFRYRLAPADVGLWERFQPRGHRFEKPPERCFSQSPDRPQGFSGGSRPCSIRSDRSCVMNATRSAADLTESLESGSPSCAIAAVCSSAPTCSAGSTARAVDSATSQPGLHRSQSLVASARTLAEK
jgi:hypothetical protein